MLLAVFAGRVSGKPLLLADINSAFGPFTTFLADPYVHKNPRDGQCGPATERYNDYSYRRVAQENSSPGISLPARGEMKLHLRGELINVFNGMRKSNPKGAYFEIGANCTAHMQVGDRATGRMASGFGYINVMNAGA